MMQSAERTKNQKLLRELKLENKKKNVTYTELPEANHSKSCSKCKCLDYEENVRFLPCSKHKDIVDVDFGTCDTFSLENDRKNL
jgi:hypothetical protein